MHLWLSDSGVRHGGGAAAVVCMNRFMLYFDPVSYKLRHHAGGPFILLRLFVNGICDYQACDCLHICILHRVFVVG